jgi:formylglycine-generating enzyme required for sulfatase activity
MAAMSGPGSFVVLERQGQARGYRQGLTSPSEGGAHPPSPLDLQLVEIPAGGFLMGSPASEAGRRDDEGPQHEVQLERFFLGRTTITQAQWRTVAGWVAGPGERWGLDLSERLEPSRFEGEQRPVERVSWFEAMEFCSRLSQRSGKTYTLPSEAQWEYACRAGTTTPFHVGDTLSAEMANYSAKFTYGRGRKGNNQQETTEVGSFPANAWGLHDMHGNVWEWCADHWHRSYDLGQQKAPSDGSPWLDGAEEGKKGEDGERRDVPLRVLRGGSWDRYPVNCRSAYRYGNHPAFALNDFGFRVCCLPRGRFSSALEPSSP